MALAVTVPEELKPYYRAGEETAPYVSLAISKNHTQKSLGPMTKLAAMLHYEPTVQPEVFYNDNNHIFKIILPQDMGDITRTSKQTRHRTHMKIPDSEKYLNQVPNHIWMTHPNDAEQTKLVFRVELTTDRLINRPQYPLKLEQMAGIEEIIDGLLMAGVIHETHSEYNTPLFPMKKSDLVNWRMVQDFRPINEVTAGESHPVPDPYIALNNLLPQHQFYTVIDLANAFFTINIAPESQKCFAFTFNGKQYTYARMPQGWKHSPGYFNNFLTKDLTDLTLSSKCTLIQYVDDILIAGPTSQDVLQATVKLLTHLSTKGYEVNSLPG
uniref:ribonuclease H n=1 Tax=Periophthalmus magnuspinnatus TaxID=409849 RepID=A0A3B4BME9_9GOBI